MISSTSHPVPVRDQVLARDGHLSELSINRYLYDPVLDTDLRDAFAEHLQSCAVCRERLKAVQDFDASLELRPPTEAAQISAVSGVSVARLEPRRPRRADKAWWGAGVALAAAAALALVMGSGPETVSGSELDTTRLKGSKLDFEVYVHDGTTSRLVDGGDKVHPGDRVAFRVATRQDGYLLVMGLDQAGSVYVCYPQQNEGMAAAFSASEKAMKLEQAMQFDTQLGRELLVAVWCPDPFHIDDVQRGLHTELSRSHGDGLPLVRAGCVQRELSLVKTPIRGDDAD